jgi:hypothetical protein
MFGITILVKFKTLTLDVKGWVPLLEITEGLNLP